MALLPKVKLKALVSFPASILDGIGIDVTRQNGSFQFDLDYGDFAPPVGAISDPAHQNVLLWNVIADSYSLVPISVVSAGGAVPEAPNDGVQYGRQSLGWTPVISGGPNNLNPVMDGVATAGIATTYARGDHVHPSDTSRAPLVSPAFTGMPTAPTAAPGTGTIQIATTAFVAAAVSGGGTFVDAPSDGSSYGRLNAAWAKVAPLADPAFTGNPTAPTPAAGDSDTSIATTAFVGTEISSKAVRYDTAQALTAPQQAQARSNISSALFDAMAYSGIQINGSMDVSQENGATASGPGYVIDNWFLQSGGVQVAAGQQVGGGPPGFINALLVGTSTANPSPAAGDYLFYVTLIEGYRIARLGWGTVSAQPLTIGFWVISTRAGLHSVSVQNATGNRTYVSGYTINTANVWEYKVLTITGDTTGTWNTNNTLGMRVQFIIMTGSTYTTAPNVWTAGNFLGVSGTVNNIVSTSDSMQFTGVVILPGIEAPSAARSPFIMRSYDQELVPCQRYLRILTQEGAVAASGATSAVGTIRHSGMRAAPAVTALDPLVLTNGTANFGQSSANMTIGSNNADYGTYFFGNFTALPANASLVFHGVASANRLKLAARL